MNLLNLIRDLSSNLTNVKHLLEDYENSKKEEIDKKKEKGKKKLLKKNIIIEQNKEKKRTYKEDFKKIEYFIDHMDESGEKNPYDKIRISKLKKVFKNINLDFWIIIGQIKRKKYLNHIMNLFFGSQILIKHQMKKYRKIFEKIHKKLDDYEYRLYMMKELSHLLPPLNIYEKKRN